MRCLVADGRGQLSVREVPRPSYNEYQALVKMESCGICRGTDTKLIHGAFKGYRSYPAILGHEGVGRVVEVGSRVTRFAVGDRVLLPFLEGVTGGYHAAWGAFSEYAVVGDADALIRDGKGPGHPMFSEAYYAQQVVPEDIPAVDAAMIVTFREVLSACYRFGFREGGSLVVFGAGPVGLTFIRIAKLLGLGPVIAAVNRDEKIPEALEAGADHAFNNRSHDPVSEVKRMLPEGVDFAVDAVGDNRVIAQSMELVKYNGKICCYGVSSELKMELDWSNAAYNWSLHFVQWPSKLEESQCHERIVSWIRSGELNPRDYYSDVMSFDDILQAFERAESGQIRKKIIIRFDSETKGGRD
jgi:threonine dehydrogenase-like Zn-dependent dehydrogenase